MAKTRLPGSSDTRIFLVGVAAFLALVAYVAVAYANTDATRVTADQLAQKVAREIAPFAPNGSKLVPVPSGTRGRTAVRVTPLAVGNYGAIAQTLAYRPPPGHKFVLSFWLRGSRVGQISRSRPGRIAVVIDEPGVGGEATAYVVNTTVPATSRWHRFVFASRVVGRRLSIAFYLSRNIYRRADVARSWFEVHDVNVSFPPR